MDYPREFDPNTIGVIVWIGPQFFLDTIADLQEYGLENPVDRSQLYGKLSGLGYIAACLQDIELCFPSDE